MIWHINNINSNFVYFSRYDLDWYNLSLFVDIECIINNNNNNNDNNNTNIPNGIIDATIHYQLW